MIPIQKGGQDLDAGTPSDPGAVGTIYGAAVDTQNFGSFLVILNAGLASATGTLTVTVQEATDSAFTSPTAVAGAAFTVVTVSNDLASYYGLIHKNGSSKRYIRTKAVVATDVVAFSTDVIKLDPVSTGDGDTFAFEV
jgi:hypothetical protein